MLQVFDASRDDDSKGTCSPVKVRKTWKIVKMICNTETQLWPNLQIMNPMHHTQHVALNGTKVGIADKMMGPSQ